MPGDDPRSLRDFFLRLNGPVSYFSVGLVLLMMLTIVYDVFARLVFRAPTLWMIDVNEYMLVYMTFVPAAWILLRDGHVKVELVFERLRPRTQRVVTLLTDLLGVFYCVILAWQGWLMAWEAYDKGHQFSTALSVPQFLVFVIIPLGSAWLGLAFLARLWTRARDGLRARDPK